MGLDHDPPAEFRMPARRSWVRSKQGRRVLQDSQIVGFQLHGPAHNWQSRRVWSWRETMQRILSLTPRGNLLTHRHFAWLRSHSLQWHSVFHAFHGCAILARETLSFLLAERWSSRIPESGRRFSVRWSAALHHIGEASTESQPILRLCQTALQRPLATPPSGLYPGGSWLQRATFE